MIKFCPQINTLSFWAQNDLRSDLRALKFEKLFLGGMPPDPPTCFQCMAYHSILASCGPDDRGKLACRGKSKSTTHLHWGVFLKQHWPALVLHGQTIGWVGPCMTKAASSSFTVAIIGNQLYNSYVSPWGIVLHIGVGLCLTSMPIPKGHQNK